MADTRPFQESDLVPIGRVGRPHGLRGAFFVVGRDGESLPKAYKQLFIGKDAAGAQPAQVQWTGSKTGQVLLICSLAADRTAVEKLTGMSIFAPADAVRAAAGTTPLWADLVGLDVEDAGGRVIGKVHHVYNAGASDIVEVHRGEAGPEARFFDLPLAAPYVDPSRLIAVDERPEGRRTKLCLLVDGEVFADLWQPVP